MDRGAWKAAVHGVAKSRTRLSDFTFTFSFFIGNIYWASQVAQLVKHLPTMQETQVQSLGLEDLLEKEVATHSGILAWKILLTEESIDHGVAKS